MLIETFKGTWLVSNSRSGAVWCDASSIALGVVLEIGGNLVKDVAWLRKKDDFAHINVAELDAVLKGINMPHQWGITNLTVISDTAKVCTWLNSVISGDRKIRIYVISKTLVMRRLGIVRELVADGKLRIQPQIVKSEENKADILTRVCMKWLKRPIVCSALSVSKVRERHNKHHFGFKKTKYFVQAENEETSDSVIQ